MSTKHNVFISYHHANDQFYKNELVKFNNIHEIFIDKSVDTNDISDELTDEEIRTKIRDEYLQDSSVTILLVGTDTKNRKHVDWEVYSSMYNGKINKKSGILVVQLPSTSPNSYNIAHESEKSTMYPQDTWRSVTTRTEYERLYPYLPDRIIDNLLASGCKITVTRWEDLNLSSLKLLIDNAFNSRTSNDYDLSRDMRRNNS